jgi:group I intron endonuclease
MMQSAQRPSSTSGIYRITNIATGKHYIGSSVNLQQRRSKHRNLLKRGENNCAKLQIAWDESGADKFKFVTLLLCEKKDLLVYEQICIDLYDAVESGYNMRPFAGCNKGFKTSEETKKKLSIASKKAATPEARAKISARNSGRIHGPEARENMSFAARSRSAATSEKMKEIWAERRAQKMALNG